MFVPMLAAVENAAVNRPRPNLAGAWTLNDAMSETAHEKMRELVTGRRSARGGFGGPPSGTGRGGRPGIEGWGGRRGGPREGQGEGGPQAGLDRGVDALAVSQTFDQLSITYSDDRLRILFTDGRKDERDGPLGKVITKARWTKQGALEVGSKSRQGKTTEIYRLDKESGRLLVDITVAGPMGEITFLRTYDRSKEAEEIPEGDG